MIHNSKLIIYTDGGARGNPGPAAVGVVIYTEPAEGLEPKKYREYIGQTTNNVAEYKAAIFALKKTKQLLGKEKAKKIMVEINTDSELLYKQARGEYKVMEPGLQPLFIEIWNLKQDFKNVNFIHIAREKNREADKLVNKELDSRMI